MNCLRALCVLRGFKCDFYYEEHKEHGGQAAAGRRFAECNANFATIVSRPGLFLAALSPR